MPAEGADSSPGCRCGGSGFDRCPPSEWVGRLDRREVERLRAAFDCDAPLGGALYRARLRDCLASLELAPLQPAIELPVAGRRWSEDQLLEAYLRQQETM